jgi:hypothetical protein
LALKEILIKEAQSGPEGWNAGMLEGSNYF